MTEPQNPKVVIQAHVLRARATRRAVLHGSRRLRTERAVAGLVWLSSLLSVAALGVTMMAAKIVQLLHHTGR